MIVTVTPNPSLDRTLEIDRLLRGEVIRPVAAHVDPGGKGINVSRALLANGHATRAVVPLGGSEGDHLEALLVALDLDVLPVRIGAAVRTNVSLVEPDGTVTKINAPGPVLEPGEVEALRKAAIEATEGADWVALSGSLPPGAPEALYAVLVDDLRSAGVRTAVDTSGAPLAAAVAARPDVVKPNREELAELAGRDLETFGDVLAAAHLLRELRIEAVLVSLGSLGAVLVDADGAVHADAPSVTPVSNVGAGDAALAGFLSAGGAGPEGLRSAVAWGTAAVQLPGTAMPGPADLDPDAVRLRDLDPDLPLNRQRSDP